MAPGSYDAPKPVPRPPALGGPSVSRGSGEWGHVAGQLEESNRWVPSSQPTLGDSILTTIHGLVSSRYDVNMPRGGSGSGWGQTRPIDAYGYGREDDYSSARYEAVLSSEDMHAVQEREREEAQRREIMAARDKERDRIGKEEAGAGDFKVLAGESQTEYMKKKAVEKKRQREEEENRERERRELAAKEKLAQLEARRSHHGEEFQPESSSASAPNHRPWPDKEIKPSSVTLLARPTALVKPSESETEKACMTPTSSTRIAHMETDMAAEDVHHSQQSMPSSAHRTTQPAEALTEHETTYHDESLENRFGPKKGGDGSSRARSLGGEGQDITVTRSTVLQPMPMAAPQVVSGQQPPAPHTAGATNKRSSLYDPSRPFASLFPSDHPHSTGSMSVSMETDQMKEPVHYEPKVEAASLERVQPGIKKLYDPKEDRLVTVEHQKDKGRKSGAVTTTRDRAEKITASIPPVMEASTPESIAQAEAEAAALAAAKQREKERQEQAEKARKEEKRQKQLAERAAKVELDRVAAEEAAKRKEIRAKERAERGPRTRGVLYRYNDQGEIVNADMTEEELAARESRERRRKERQDERSESAKEGQTRRPRGDEGNEKGKRKTTGERQQPQDGGRASRRDGIEPEVTPSTLVEQQTALPPVPPPPPPKPVNAWDKPLVPIINQQLAASQPPPPPAPAPVASVPSTDSASDAGRQKKSGKQQRKEKKPLKAGSGTEQGTGFVETDIRSQDGKSGVWVEEQSSQEMDSDDEEGLAVKSRKKGKRQQAEEKKRPRAKEVMKLVARPKAQQRSTKSSPQEDDNSTLRMDSIFDNAGVLVGSSDSTANPVGLSVPDKSWGSGVKLSLSIEEHGHDEDDKQGREGEGDEDSILFGVPSRSSSGTPLSSTRDEMSLPLKSQSPSPFIASGAEGEGLKAKGDPTVRPMKLPPAEEQPSSSSSSFISGSLPGLATEAVGPVKQALTNPTATWDQGVVIRPPGSLSSTGTNVGASGSPSAMPWSSSTWGDTSFSIPRTNTAALAPGEGRPDPNLVSAGSQEIEGGPTSKSGATPYLTPASGVQEFSEYPSLPVMNWLSQIRVGSQPTPLLMQSNASTW